MPRQTWTMPRHMGPFWAGESLVDKAAALQLTVPEMTALLGGLRALDANTGRAFLLKTWVGRFQCRGPGICPNSPESDPPPNRSESECISVESKCPYRLQILPAGLVEIRPNPPASDPPSNPPESGNREPSISKQPERLFRMLHWYHIILLPMMSFNSAFAEFQAETYV